MIARLSRPVQFHPMVVLTFLLLLSPLPAFVMLGAAMAAGFGVFALMTRIPIKRGRIGHVAKGVPYFVGNSYRFLHSLVGRRKWADRDVHRTKDGVLVVSHWGKLIRRGHFHDSAGKILNKDVQIEDLTWAEVSRFRAVYRGRVYRIHTLHDDMRASAALGINDKLEPKSNRLASTAIWQPVKDWEMALRKAHPSYRISGYTIGRNRKNEAPMKAVGIPMTRIKRW